MKEEQVQNTAAKYSSQILLEFKSGNLDMVEELTQKFPLSEPQIIGEQNQKEFIAFFGAILRMRIIGGISIHKHSGIRPIAQ